jgi:hypothetical protein
VTAKSCSSSSCILTYSMGDKKSNRPFDIVVWGVCHPSLNATRNTQRATRNASPANHATYHHEYNTSHNSTQSHTQHITQQHLTHHTTPSPAHHIMHTRNSSCLSIAGNRLHWNPDMRVSTQASSESKMGNCWQKWGKTRGFKTRTNKRIS